MSVPNYLTPDEFKYTASLAGYTFADNDISSEGTTASRVVDKYTGRYFYSNTGTAEVRYYSPPRAGCLIDCDDIIALGTVNLDLDRDGVFETTWTQGTHFNLWPYNAALEGRPYEAIEIIPRSGAYLPCWPRSIRVTARFGWEDIPAGVKDATNMLVGRFLKRKREAPFGIVGLGVDQVAVRIPKTDPDVAMMLEPYLKNEGVMAA